MADPKEMSFSLPRLGQKGGERGNGSNGIKRADFEHEYEETKMKQGPSHGSVSKNKTCIIVVHTKGKEQQYLRRTHDSPGRFGQEIQKEKNLSPPKQPNFGLSVCLSVCHESRLVHVVATAQVGKFATLQAGVNSRVYKIRSLV